jgi:hypothetical protein
MVTRVPCRQVDSDQAYASCDDNLAVLKSMTCSAVGTVILMHAMTIVTNHMYDDHFTKIHPRLCRSVFFGSR